MRAPAARIGLPSGDRQPADDRGPLAPGAVWVLGVVVGLAVLVGTAATAGVSSRLITIAAAVVGGAALTAIAVTRFWLMLLVLFAIRTSLDALKSDAYSSGALDPGTAVGAVFLAAALLWLAVQWRSGRWAPVSAVGLALLALAGAAILSSLGAEMRIQSLQNSSKLLSVAVMLVVLEQVFNRNPGRIRPLLVAMAASLVVPAIVGYAQLPSARPSSDVYDAIGVGRVRGTFVHPNTFAAYLAIAILLAAALLPYVNRTWRRVLVGVIVVAAPLMLFTYARGAWIALYIGLLFIGLAQTRWLVIGLLLGVVVLALAIPSVATRLSELNREEHPGELDIDPNSFSWRLGYWGRVLPLAAENPVTGIGFEQVREETPEQLPPHNAFVQVFVEMGMLGLTAMVAFITLLALELHHAARRLRRGFGRGMAVASAAIAVALLVQFFSENVLNQPAVLWYFIAPLAWVLVAARRPARALGAVEATRSPVAVA